MEKSEIVKKNIELIKDYVRRQGSCEPDQVELLTEPADPVPVWKVTVKEWGEIWKGPPPPYWFVCPQPMMNLYRPDCFHPKPWKKWEEQDKNLVLDHAQSFHIGVCTRLSWESEEKSAEGESPSVH